MPADLAKHLNPLLTSQQIQAFAAEMDAFWSSLPPATRQSELVSFGDQASRFYGAGMDYAESSLYQPGDDLRHLNWRLMARTGKAFTKKFIEERQTQLVILLDRRASMRFASQGELKLVQGLKFAGWLAWLAQKQAVQVKAFGFAAELLQTQALQGRSVYAGLMQVLATGVEPGFAGSVERSEPNLPAVFSQIQPQIAGGAQIWLISDFADLTSDNQAWLQMLNEKYEIHAVWVSDKLDYQLPAQENLRLQSAGEVFQVSATQQQEFNAWALQERANKRSWLQNTGVQLVEIDTQDGLAEFVAAQLKSQANLREKS